MSSKGSSQSPPWWWWWCCRQQQPGSVLEGTTGRLASSSLQTPWIGTRHRRWGNIRHVSNVWQINPLHISVLLGSWRISGRVEVWGCGPRYRQTPVQWWVLLDRCYRRRHGRWRRCFDHFTNSMSLLSFKGTFKWAESHQAMDYYNWWEGQVILACDWLMATILTCHWSAHQRGQWRGLRLCAQVPCGVSPGNNG